MPLLMDAAFEMQASPSKPAAAQAEAPRGVPAQQMAVRTWLALCTPPAHALWLPVQEGCNASAHFIAVCPFYARVWLMCLAKSAQRRSVAAPLAAKPCCTVLLAGGWALKSCCT